MSSPLNAVFFDLDGTLLDTAPDFVAVVNRLRLRHNRDALPYEQIRATVSHGARALITLAFELDEGDDEFEALRQELLIDYSNNLAEETCPFPGIESLLSWLDDNAIPWGVVTNKPSTYTLPLLDQLHLLDRCAAIICPDHVTHTKPDPEPLLLACSHSRCQPATAVYVGDHQRDIEAGRRAGMKTIAAGYGYIDTNDSSHNWQADYHVESADEILPLLLRNFFSNH